jgi:hypothetical protein
MRGQRRLRRGCGGCGDEKEVAGVTSDIGQIQDTAAVGRHGQDSPRLCEEIRTFAARCIRLRVLYSIARTSQLETVQSITGFS